MSHQHARELDFSGEGQAIERLHDLYKSGFRHFAISDYYPSHPYHPLPDEINGLADIISSPNAEHHSCTDHPVHFNTIGSYFRSGFGLNLTIDTDSPHVEHTLTDLNIFDPDSRIPGEGVYALHVQIEALDPNEVGASTAKLSISGALACDHRTFEVIGNGKIENRGIGAGPLEIIRIRVQSGKVFLRLDYDPRHTQIKRLRWMQGTQRPWRQAFLQALDGQRTDSNKKPVEGLVFSEGGGITINHPRHPVADSLEMLDFDERVLGVEIWNHRRWFGPDKDGRPMSYYNHWQDILNTGRRCFAFMARDHRNKGRGRNVLIVPDPSGRTMEQRHRDALQAYRQGCFFGAIGATTVDTDNQSIPPRDHTQFRFERIEIVQDTNGKPAALEIRVGGHNTELRPNIQIRFITEGGIAGIFNGSASACFELPRNDDDSITLKYIRVEAFAFPDTHLNGQALHADHLAELSVYEISRLHDVRGFQGHNDRDVRGDEPIGIVDMLFSQPIRF